jgi:hypothetical protein
MLLEELWNRLSPLAQLTTFLFSATWMLRFLSYPLLPHIDTPSLIVAQVSIISNVLICSFEQTTRIMTD